MKEKNKKITSNLSIFLIILVIIGFAWNTMDSSTTFSAYIEENPATENYLIETREIRGHVALTFDDGPHPIHTPALLDALQERDARATFFLLGSKIKEHPEIVARMHEEGHLIGNHTYSHPILQYLNNSCMLEEIVSTNLLIEKITGNLPNIFRPPFGQKDSRVIDVARQLNMSVILWSVDPWDWAYRNTNITFEETVESIYESIMEYLKDGSIVVLHDVFETTIAAAIKVMDTLIDKGYVFVTVKELFELNDINLEAGGIYYSVYPVVRRGVL